MLIQTRLGEQNKAVFHSIWPFILIVHSPFPLPPPFFFFSELLQRRTWNKVPGKMYLSRAPSSCETFDKCRSLLWLFWTHIILHSCLRCNDLKIKIQSGNNGLLLRTSLNIQMERSEGIYKHFLQEIPLRNRAIKIRYSHTLSLQPLNVVDLQVHSYF